MRRWTTGLLALLVTLSLSASAFAQGGGASSTGTIQGRVAVGQVEGIEIRADRARGPFAKRLMLSSMWGTCSVHSSRFTVQGSAHRCQLCRIRTVKC